jgi:hypothetical protein
MSTADKPTVLLKPETDFLPQPANDHPAIRIEPYQCACGTTMRKTFNGNFRCQRCRVIYDPHGSVIYSPTERR